MLCPHPSTTNGNSPSKVSVTNTWTLIWWGLRHSSSPYKLHYLHTEYSHCGWSFVGHMPFFPSIARKFPQSYLLLGLMPWHLTKTNSLFMEGGEWRYQQIQAIWSENKLDFIIHYNLAKISIMGKFNLT